MCCCGENKKHHFIGFTHFKWFVLNIIKIYSNEKSYFSKKRLESGAAFTVGMWGMIYWFIINAHTVDINNVIIWIAPLFFISGYQLSQIQKEKNEITKNGNN